MVVAIPPLLFPCGLCPEEFPPEGLAPHLESEQYYPSYISYLRSWIGDHADGESSSPVSKKRKRGNSPVGSIPVGSSPKNVSVNNSPLLVGSSSPVREVSPSHWQEIHRCEWLLFLPARRVQMTTCNVE